MNKIVLTLIALGLVALLATGTFANDFAQKIEPTKKVYLSNADDAPASSSSGGGTGTTPACPRYYTCPNGKQVPWCKSSVTKIPQECTQTEEGIVTCAGGSGNAGCACIENPASQCSSNLIKISLNPEKQMTDDGTATYTVIVQDLHPSLRCSGTERCDTKEYEYELFFSSKRNVDFSDKPALEGEFETKTFSLRAGETKTVELNVEANFKGTHIFNVVVAGAETKQGTKGLLVFGEEPEQPIPAYFVGQGFALNQQTSQGRLVDFHILKDRDEIKGKMGFGLENFRLSGTVSNEEVYFSIYERKDAGLTVSVGEFHGQITKYDRFLLLEGDLEFETAEGLTWHLTAISTKKAVFRPIIVRDVEETVTSSIEEVILIERSQSDELAPEPLEGGAETGQAVSIIPKRFTKRFFGIENPWIGERVLNVEVINPEGKVTKKTLRPFKDTRVGDYDLELKSTLDNGEDFDIAVKKA